MKNNYLNEGDILEIPKDPCVRKIENQYFIAVLRNKQPFIVDLGLFTLQDYYGNAAHSVSQELMLRGCQNEAEIVSALCGKTVKCENSKIITVPYTRDTTVSINIIQMDFE